MHKVQVLALLILFLSSCERTDPPLILHDDWLAYQNLFISKDGRVVDTGNKGISHSEGQGYAMLLAVAARDRITFDRIWIWTRNNLQVRDDHLFAWKWDPDTKNHVLDKNNASDGDLLIAWALYRAASLWDSGVYKKNSISIVHDIRRKLIKTTKLGPVLLPGEKGFVHGNNITLNLSYWVYPALREISHFDPDPIWEKIIKSGKILSDMSQFGQFKLPPDWIVLRNENVSLSKLLSARFGFDALRIPLYFCWDKQYDVDVLENIDSYWTRPNTSAWIDLNNGDSASYVLTSGQRRIAHMLQRCLHNNSPSLIHHEILESNTQNSTDYYSVTLSLLARIAEIESQL